MMFSFKRMRSLAGDAAYWLRDAAVLRRPAVILMYHSISDAPVPWAVSPVEFAWQMAYLDRCGYSVLSLAECFARITRGDALPRRSVIITFDDGYEDNYTAAFPVLSRYRYPATIFVTTGFINNKDHVSRGCHFRMLDESQMRQMAASGLIAFGSHTLTHPRLSRLSCGEIRKEVSASREALCAIVPGSGRFFAYPYGDYSPAVLGIVREHFEAAVTVRRGLIPARPSPFELPRQAVDGAVTRARFALKLSL